MNNLKQISLAVQNFHSARNRIPRSHNYEELSGRGWITESLPFLEEQAKYDIMEPYFDGKFGDGTGINHPDLANIVNKPIPTFRCPSAASLEFGTDQFQWGGREHALTNYKGIIGNNKMGNVGVGTPDCHRSPDCDGLFWRFSFMKTIRFKNIVDGLSKTFLAGDDLPRFNRHSAMYHGNGDYSSTHFPMNVKTADPTTISGNWPLSITFRSDHTGGCYFAFVDGSVSFINESIDFDTYRFLSTRNGEEVVSGYLN
jgi:prepilin-type processing-associated H-X9-DG protein